MMICVMLLFELSASLMISSRLQKKHNLGLRAWQKIVLQVGFAAVLGASTFPCSQIMEQRCSFLSTAST